MRILLSFNVFLLIINSIVSRNSVGLVVSLVLIVIGLVIAVKYPKDCDVKEKY